MYTLQYKGKQQNEGRQGNYYDDREEHEGHWACNCSGHFSMAVKLGGEK
jgi:hypothetical protein